MITAIHRQPNDLNETRGVARDKLRYAAEQESLQPLPPVGTDNNQIATPFRSSVDDLRLDISFPNDVIYFKTCCGQLAIRSGRVSLNVELPQSRSTRRA